jgi:hypothetical protein
MDELKVREATEPGRAMVPNDPAAVENAPPRPVPADPAPEPALPASETAVLEPPLEQASTEEAVLDLLYACNIMEDWDGLRELMEYMVKRKPELLILTNVLLNPLSEEEVAAFRHANRYVTEAFKKDGNFSDIQLFVESFRHDSATDVVAVSARQMLTLIDSGKRKIAERLSTLESILKRCPCPFYIVPGRYEDLDMIKAAGPAGLASRYLSVRKVTEKGFKILGIGGLPGVAEDCPVAFQEREYFDGSSQSDEYLQEVIGDDLDILVSLSPIRHYTDPGEDHLVRDFISRYLPGKLILTCQPLKDYEQTCLAASGAELIRGGYFGRGKASRSRTFWELAYSKRGLADKSLFELKMKKSFRML